MKFYNCMTHALSLEEKNLSSRELDLWYSKNPFSEISEKCNQYYKRSCRKVDRNEKLQPNEWLVVFFGFVVTKVDYDGHPEYWDYHFARQENDGTWTERPSKYEEISVVDIDNMIFEYSKIGIFPMFLAIGEVEE